MRQVNEETTEGSFVVRIGPLMKEALEEQKKIIKEVTYDVCNPSDFEAGEIIAKKFLKMI